MDFDDFEDLVDVADLLIDNEVTDAIDDAVDIIDFFF